MSRVVSIEKVALVGVTVGEVLCGLLLPATTATAVGIICGLWAGWWLRGRAR